MKASKQNQNNTIFIIRHGQDTDNAKSIINGWRNTSLTILGQKEAIKTAQKLKKERIDFIYSSPLKRAQETAQIIAKALKIRRIIKDKRLIERNFGILTGKPLADISKYSREIIITSRANYNYFLDGKGVENFDSVCRRARLFLHEIIKKYHNKKIVLVTHDNAGKVLQAIWRGWSWKFGLRKFYFANAGIIKLNGQPKI